MTERIIVSGIYRSGTSLTAELIHRWGAFAGREEEILKDQYCYMEYLPLQKLNEELLNNNSRVPTSINELMAKAEIATYKERALELLDTMDKEAEQNHATAWVWKDPQLPLVIPFWAEIWGDVIHVIPVRHPVETILSAASTEGLVLEEVPLSAGFAYWQFCMLNLLSFTRNSNRKLFIAYDQLVRKPLQECERLCQFLDVHSGTPAETSEQRIEAMASQIVTGQHHFKQPGSLAEIETTTREQRALYDFLRVKTMYPNEPFNEDDFALYPGWREYLQVMDMLLSSSNPLEGQEASYGA